MGTWQKFASWSVLVVTGILSTASSALAYRVSEHELMTQIAVTEMNRCLPGLVSTRFLELLIAGNSAEDHDLIQKWRKYSHFYNPVKNIRFTFRRSSMARIELLEGKLWDLLNGAGLDRFEFDFGIEDNDFSENKLTVPEKIAKLLGGLIHHIQDVSVPAHVVPVMHGFGDGFESMVLEETTYSGGFDFACPIDQIVEKGEAAKILKETALATLKALDGKFIIIRDERLEEVDWQAFWESSPYEEFGRYGFLGNHFGESSFQRDKARFEVPMTEMKRLRVQQAQLAIQKTIQTLYPVLRMVQQEGLSVLF